MFPELDYEMHDKVGMLSSRGAETNKNLYSTRGISAFHNNFEANLSHSTFFNKSVKDLNQLIHDEAEP